MKKEAVQKVLNNDEAEANKGNKSNPIATRTSSPKKYGSTSASKEKNPNPIVFGIEEANKKDSTIEWVHSRFGTNKEELRQLNVTINHSCHEIPSHTFEESTKVNATDNEATFGYPLWSDEVENMVKNNEENSTRMHAQTGGVQGKTADLIPPAKVNPSAQKSRVENYEELNRNHDTLSAEEAQRSHKQVEITGGSTGGASARKKSNVTVIPRDLTQDIDDAGGAPVEILSGDLVEKASTKVLEDTVKSAHQTTKSKEMETNGTVFATCAIVNPTLGSFYDLQFRVMLEALRTMEKNALVLKEDTRQSHDPIDLATGVCASKAGQSNANNKEIQIAVLAMDDHGILARKKFSVTSGILAKGMLINHRGQKELQMIAKRHSQILWHSRWLTTIKVSKRN
ncbi:hypothetical protein A4A49_09155 [Nicotiana attenuata]|uniref:Uncharacterized protein n=1 Tax=Nicotiana attenuata TaxID=49451 RepID=A0A1J6IWJ7_NICAT|nr:hypothetical protein A4A49_09155 [Nicotiana attenuata]